MYFSFAQVGQLFAGLILSMLGAHAAAYVAAKTQQVKTQTANLAAKAAAIANPVERTLAQVGVALLPTVEDAAAAALQASRDSVVSAVSNVNPSAGALVGTLIDTALTTPPAPAAPASTSAAS
jgi:hypothetical protein